MAESQTSQNAIRMLPHDDEAEKAVLGALLLNPDKLNIVLGVLEASDFYSPANGIIFEAICHLVDEENEKNVDGLILTNYLQKCGKLDKCGGMGYIALLTNTQVIVSNILSYCDIVKTASKRRLLYQLSHSLEKNAFDPAINVDEALEDGSKILSDTLLKGMKDSAKDYELGTILTSTYEDILRKIDGKGEKDRVETGFEILDKYTNGGLGNDNYIIIGARPSIGKSAFAVSMMYNMIRSGKKIAFFSLEMSAKDITKRLLAIDSKIELGKIIKAYFIGDELNRFMDSVSRLYQYKDNLYIVDVPNISLTELRTKARILKKEKDVDCIVIDYIGLISLPQAGVNQKKFEIVSYVSLALKQLARELNVPVVALCQVGRQSEEQAPILSDLRDSGSIEQDADLVCFLHRKKILTEEEKQKNLRDNQGRANIQVTQFIVAKNRNGETGTFKVGYNGPLTYYTDVAQDSIFIDYEPKPNNKKGSN